MKRYRLRGGSIQEATNGPYVRIRDLTDSIEEMWDKQCAGWKAQDCESCRRFYDVITLIDPKWDKWDGQARVQTKGTIGYVT